jgi:curved DNA-binding protein CbpA
VGAELHPELTAKLSQVRFADYFALLEVEPDASTWVIREGHDRLARRFSARGWPHRLSPAELEALDEVGRGLADAFLVLGDDELRARYQRSLAAAAQGAAPTAPAPRSTLPVR